MKPLFEDEVEKTYPASASETIAIYTSNPVEPTDPDKHSSKRVRRTKTIIRPHRAFPLKKEVSINDEGDIRAELIPLRELIPVFEERIQNNAINKTNNSYSKNTVKFSLTNTSWINKRLRKIEALYGSDIHLYFKYMLYFLYLSFVNFLITFAFVIVPYYLSYFGVFKATIILLPQCETGKNITYGEIDITRIKEVARKVKGFLYGTYNIDRIYETYNFPLAYALTFFSSVILILLFMMYRSSKINGRTFSLDDSHYCSTTILSGYNFFVTDIKDTKTYLYKTAKDLNAYSKHMIRLQKSKQMGIKIYFFRTLMTLYSIAYYGLTCFALYKAHNYIDDAKTNNEFSSWMNLIPSTMISVMRIVYENATSFLIKLEMYNATLELVIYMIRLLIFMCTALTIYLKDQFEKNPNQNCWESYIGLNLMIFVVVNFLFEIGIHVLAILRLKFLNNCNRKRWKFTVSPMLLQVFIDQTAVWLGLFFCPWISLFMTFKLLLTILFTPFMIKNYYRIEPSFYNTYILKYLCDKCLWVFYLYYVALLGYSFTSVNISACGLFGITDCKENIYLTDRIISLLVHPVVIKSPILRYIGSIAFGFFIINILCMIISEIRNRARFNKISLDLNEKYFKYVVEDNKDLVKEILSLKSRNSNNKNNLF